MTHAQWREPPNESSLPLLFVHFIVFPLVADIAATATTRITCCDSTGVSIPTVINDFFSLSACGDHDGTRGNQEFFSCWL